jgi:hypothetical protein
MTERPDNPSRQITPDARPKKQWVDPEIEIVPASETSLGATLGGADFGSNIAS